MDKQEKKQCICSKCGTKGEVTIYHMMTRDELHEASDMSIFKWKCPKCGHEYRLIYPCIFYNPQGEYVVRFLGQEKVLDFDLDYSNCVCRDVESTETFSEKIRVMEAGLDDRALELLKLLIFAKIHVEDDTMESIYFYQMSADDSLEFTIFTGKGPDGITVSNEMYHNVCNLANEVDYKEEGFMKIDLNWAGSQVKE